MGRKRVLPAGAVERERKRTRERHEKRKRDRRTDAEESRKETKEKTRKKERGQVDNVRSHVAAFRGKPLKLTSPGQAMIHFPEKAKARKKIDKRKKEKKAAKERRMSKAADMSSPVFPVDLPVLFDRPDPADRPLARLPSQIKKTHPQPLCFLVTGSGINAILLIGPNTSKIGAKSPSATSGFTFDM